MHCRAALRVCRSAPNPLCSAQVAALNETLGVRDSQLASLQQTRSSPSGKQLTPARRRAESQDLQGPSQKLASPTQAFLPFTLPTFSPTSLSAVHSPQQTEQQHQLQQQAGQATAGAL